MHLREGISQRRILRGKNFCFSSSCCKPRACELGRSSSYNMAAVSRGGYYNAHTCTQLASDPLSFSLIQSQPRYSLGIELLRNVLHLPWWELNIPGVVDERSSPFLDFCVVGPPLSPTGLSWGKPGLPSSSPPALLSASPLIPYASVPFRRKGQQSESLSV